VRWSREQWVQVVESFERSGQSHERFCVDRGLNVGSFRGWLYRLRREGARSTVARSATRLLPVRIAPPASPEDGTALEITVGDVAVRVRGAIGPRYVAELIAELRGRC
jgi:hypothetical protein